VAVLVVDALEVVEVERQRRRGLAVPVGAGGGAFRSARSTCGWPGR
jgi:hypothetical protein